MSREAVIGYGADLGPVSETKGFELRRDARFPIRVTVQFYQATSNGALDQAVVDRLAAQIDRVYKQADYVGSLSHRCPGKSPHGFPWPTAATGVLGGILD